MGVYRKKPVEIEATQLVSCNEGEQLIFKDTPDWLYDSFEDGTLRRSSSGSVIVKTLEGEMSAYAGWWIIKGIEGELYPCKPSVFQSTYEKVV